MNDQLIRILKYATILSGVASLLLIVATIVSRKFILQRGEFETYFMLLAASFVTVSIFTLAGLLYLAFTLIKRKL